MPRLFTALNFSSRVNEEILNIRCSLPSVRWLPENQLHTTLKFIGNVNNNLYGDITEALNQIDFEPFEITIEGAGCFPLRGSPKILWIGINKTAELINLQKNIDNKLIKLGLPGETRKFFPHITVGRIKKRIRRSQAAPFILSNNLFKIESIEIDSFHLFSSDLKPEGATHFIEETYTASA